MNENSAVLLESLSSRQRQVLDLAARRLNSKEIARELGLSPATVDSHVAAILAKLGVATRRDAVVLLLTATGSSLAEAAQHGGDPVVNRPPWYHRLFPFTDGNGSPKGSRPSVKAATPGMASAFVRFVVDAFYVVLFFAIMSAAAYGAHEVVHFCEERNIDQIVLWVLKGVSYLLVIIDGFGVISATGVLTYRFILAIIKADHDKD